VFLIVPRNRELASWHNAELEESVRGRFRNGASPSLNGGKIDDAIGDGPPDLHWQVDAERQKTCRERPEKDLAH
jgi:hypothetical protein